MYEALAEIRNWLTLGLAVVGGFVTIQTYLNAQKQRRLENSFRLLKLFNELLDTEDISAWKFIFHATSEPAGAKDGYMVVVIDNRFEQLPLSDLFSEGTPDNGAIERMAELFDLIAFEATKNTIEFRVVYFQLGQLMNSVHLWLTKIEAGFMKENYPYFARLYEKKLIDERWATKTYTHIA